MHSEFTRAFVSVHFNLNNIILTLPFVRSELTNDRKVIEYIITTVLNVLKISEDTMEWM